MGLQTGRQERHKPVLLRAQRLPAQVQVQVQASMLLVLAVRGVW